MTTRSTAKAAEAKAAEAKADEAAADTKTEATDGDPTRTNSIVEPKMPLRETTTDRAGVERIVNTYDDGWQPAPVAASDEAVQAAKDLEDRRKKETEDGLAALDAKRESDKSAQTVTDNTGSTGDTSSTRLPDEPATTVPTAETGTDKS